MRHKFVIGRKKFLSVKSKKKSITNPDKIRTALRNCYLDFPYGNYGLEIRTFLDMIIGDETSLILTAVELYSIEK